MAGASICISEEFRMIERHRPRNNAAWHRLRGRDVTASVAGALIGAHEFTTRFELWALKSGRILADPDETPAIRRGRLLEPVAVQLLREDRPTWQITHNSGAGMTYFRDAEFRIGGTPDVIAYDESRGQGVVQIKSVERSTFKRKWLGENDLPEPPLWIAVQAILEAYLTGSEWAAVAPLVVGHGIDLPIIDIPLIPGVVDRIKEESLEFWRMVDEGEEPPVDFSRDGDAIDSVYALDQGEEIDLSRSDRIDELVGTRWMARDRIKSGEEALAAIDTEIKALMKGARIAYLKGGARITWKSQRRIGPDGKSGSFRVLRVPSPE
jgi:hypothetical protein